MPITTPLPTPPNSVSRVSTFSADTDAFLAALAQFQSEMNSFASSVSPIGRNLLINAGFDINQRSAASNSDDTYAHDRWIILTQSGTVACTTLSSPVENGYAAALRITQSQASAQRFGFEQIIENANCIHLIGQTATLSGRVRCSVSTNIRYAILGNTAAGNTVTSDVVNDWTSGSYTSGGFFLASGVRVIAVGVQAVVADTWTNFAALVSAAVAAGSTNIMVVVWTETAQAQNVTLDCDYMQLEQGSSETPFEKRTVAREMLDCMRYFYNRTYANGEFAAVGTAWGSTTFNGKLFDIAPMRSAPTVTLAGGFAAWSANQVSQAALSSMTVSADAYGSVNFGGTWSSSGWTAGQAILLSGGSSTAVVKLDAEL